MIMQRVVDDIPIGRRQDTVANISTVAKKKVKATVCRATAKNNINCDANHVSVWNTRGESVMADG